MEERPTGMAWGSGQRLLTVGLVLMVTGVAFEGLAVPTVLPAALEELRGVDLYGWAFSGFWLANLVGITLAGADADRDGPLRPFAIGTFAFSGGLVIAGVAPEMGWVVAGRVVQGLGAGGVSAITYVAIARGYARPAQPRMIAIISSAWVLPGLLGPLVAGWITEQLDWRWAFLGLAPLLPLAALAAAPALARLGAARSAAVSSPRSGSAVVDALLLALGAAAILTALGGLDPLISPIAAVLGVVLAARPLRRLMPPGTLTARPGRGATMAVLALVSVAFFGVEAFVPLAVASVRNAGAIAGGLALTAAAVTWAAGSWVQARLAGTGLRRRLTVVGLLLIGLGIVLETAVPLTALAPVWLAAAAWAVAGLGMGMTYSTLTLVAIETAPPGNEGATSASIQLANSMGIALGTGVAGAVVALSAGGPLGLAPGIAIANLVLLLALGAAVVAARRVPQGAQVAPGRATVIGIEHGPALSP